MGRQNPRIYIYDLAKILVGTVEINFFLKFIDRKIKLATLSNIWDGISPGP